MAFRTKTITLGLGHEKSMRFMSFYIPTRHIKQLAS